MLKYSSLRYNNPDSDGVLILNAYGDHYWQKLSVEGKRLQSKVLGDYNKYKIIVENIVNSTDTEKFEDYHKVIYSHIVQDGSTWSETTQKAADKVSEAFTNISILLDGLHSKEQECIIVPDTNALIMNPDLRTWRFDGINKFTMILTPTILDELDSNKINYSNNQVKEKSLNIIRQIKEYRRRGNISNGVPILKDVISLQLIAVEPDFSKTLAWLDQNNNDDRFLASVYEIIRTNIRSSVCIVTEDINMQNKAENACIPFCEPPMPIKNPA